MKLGDAVRAVLPSWARRAAVRERPPSADAAERRAQYELYRATPEYAAAFSAAEPLVTVCMTTMDRAQMLMERSLASVLAQSYERLQIVVVGDNCVDDTETRVRAVADPRVEFRNLPQRGPYPRPGLARWAVAGTNAVNAALDMARGDFVTHLDDDDAMVPNRIERLVAAALERSADFLFHPFYRHGAKGVEIVGTGQLRFGVVTTGSIFYHRYFAAIPWDVYAYRAREPGDWNRIRRIKELEPRLSYVDEPLFHHYRDRPDVPFVARPGEQYLD